MSARATCPHCGRKIGTQCGRWNPHALIANGHDYCPMSDQLVSITGHEPIHYTRRAKLVCELASNVRDTDPRQVWHYLTATPADELQRLLMVALAGIDVDKPESDIFGWVMELPVAVSA